MVVGEILEASTTCGVRDAGQEDLAEKPEMLKTTASSDGRLALGRFPPDRPGPPAHAVSDAALPVGHSHVAAGQEQSTPL